MPEGVGYGPQNTLSVGKDIHVIGRHVYAYSNAITTVNNAYATLLSFTTGNYYTVADFILNASTTDNDPAAGLRSNFKITMNGVVVCTLATVSGQGSAASSTDVIPLVIPPHTTVVVGNRATATTGTVYCQITGKLYGKVD